MKEAGALMKIKSLVSGLLLIMCCFIMANIFMGMIKPPSFSEEFADIRKNMSKNAATEMNNDLTKVQAALDQSNFPQARILLLALRDGALKNKLFQTADFGEITGEDIINIYFGNLINKLERESKKPAVPTRSSARQPSPPIQKSGQHQLAQEFAHILNSIPDGPNIENFKKPLMVVQNLLSQPQPNVLEAFKTLQRIRESNFLKNTQFTNPFEPGSSITGTDLFNFFILEFMRDLAIAVQSAQPHTAGTPYGLVNRNQSCFMNSSIQSLVSLDKMTKLLLSLSQDYYLKNTISAVYMQLLHTMQTQPTAVIDPTDLGFCILGWNLLHSAPGNQEDAGEFVSEFLGRLVEDDVNPVRNPQRINEELLALLRVRIIEATYENINGQNTRIKERELNLPTIPPQVPILPGNVTLVDCLKGYFSKTIHDPAAANRTIVRALASTSDYFICSISRLVYLAGKATRIDKPISFELENFDISVLSLIPNKKLPLYRCKAFIAHAGSEVGGHYIAFIRMNNEWYMCDDTNISLDETNEAQKFARSGSMKTEYESTFVATVFFYERQ